MNIYKLIMTQFSALLVGLAAVLTVSEYSRVQAQQPDGNTTIEEIAESEAAIGEEVTVRGEVEDVESGVSFAIESDGLFESEKVLVINVSEQVIPEDTDDLKLQVTGEVANLVLADVERDYGLDLDPELYVDYEEQPVILATYMVSSPELEEVSENPENYYGQEIAIEGEVDEIRNAFAFTLEEEQLIGGDDLLLINATVEPIPEQGETVVVTGIVRPFVKAELERDYDLTWDLDVQSEIEAEYSEKPVLVVDSIYPSAQDEGILE